MPLLLSSNSSHCSHTCARHCKRLTVCYVVHECVCSLRIVNLELVDVVVAVSSKTCISSLCLLHIICCYPILCTALNLIARTYYAAPDCTHEHISLAIYCIRDLDCLCCCLDCLRVVRILECECSKLEAVTCICIRI